MADDCADVVGPEDVPVAATVDREVLLMPAVEPLLPAVEPRLAAEPTVAEVIQLPVSPPEVERLPLTPVAVAPVLLAPAEEVAIDALVPEVPVAPEDPLTADFPEAELARELREELRPPPSGVPA